MEVNQPRLDQYLDPETARFFALADPKYADIVPLFGATLCKMTTPPYVSPGGPHCRAIIPYEKKTPSGTDKT